MSEANSPAGAVRPPDQWRQMCCTHLGPDRRWSDDAIQAQLAHFPGWALEPAAQTPASGNSDLPVLVRRYRFADFNALEPVVIRLMAIARLQDHHPDVTFGFSHLSVHWNTHSAGGISDNDWICIALLDEAITTVTR